MKRQTLGSVGFDVFLEDNDFSIDPNQQKSANYKYFDLNINYEIRSRSGLSSKGLFVVGFNNSQIFFFNISNNSFNFKKGDRIAQVVFTYTKKFYLKEMEITKKLYYNQENIEKNIILKSKEITLVDTGLSVKLPSKTELQIFTPDVLSNNGCFLLNSPATIDTDYRNQIKLIIYNSNNFNFFWKIDHIPLGLNKVNLNPKNKKLKTNKIFIDKKRTVYEKINGDILEVFLNYKLTILANSIIKIPIILKDLDYKNIKIKRDVIIAEKVYIINYPGDFSSDLFLTIKNFNDFNVTIEKLTQLCSLINENRFKIEFKKKKIKQSDRGGLGSTGI